MAKAKPAPKETSLPLVFALVFFVLTTIAFGVMWYMQYSDQQAKDQAVEKAKKDVSTALGGQKESDQKTKLYRIFLGMATPEEVTALIGERKPGDSLSTELKAINAKLAAAAGFADVSQLPAELKIWLVDDANQIGDAPTRSILEVIADATKKRDEAVKAAAADRDTYGKQIAAIKDAIAAYDKMRADFDKTAKSLPDDFKAKFEAVKKTFDDRTKLFTANEARSREDISKLEEEKARGERDRTKLKDQVASLQEQIGLLASKAAEKQDALQFDEPQGKILRRLPDGTVEISLGRADLVREGLTFSVLPYDFPEKGRQSRIRVIRMPDQNGFYKNVERFIEKATIEVIQILGDHVSKARITQEYDTIRDGAGPGDLLYNAAWRKGTADHIALVGIFDLNGDGSDDIAQIVRDFTRMGIPVDAYFDMKTRKWVGQLTEQTRYIVEGYYPIQAAVDPNRDEKTKLIGAMSDAVKEAKSKGITPVGFRDFFPRMGYRVKVDISPDKINQATAPYLNRVNTIDAPPMNP